ncbi:MAG: hypothetical protein CVU97_00590 [Firmicutes bacterium HGW-Firmicutes-21]|nr:MAG: hypothetical protein CVU97_00590 [Firmicutes bacterium HGW-Firmicutes-21]
MKKVAFLIAVVMLFTLFTTSCYKTEEDSSEDESIDDTSTPVTQIEEITPEFSTVISIGKAYTVNAEPGEAYPDTYGKELTDGIFTADGAGYTDSKLSGWTADPLIVTIDLGETFDKIYAFEASYLSTRLAGIAPPSSVTIKYSEDNKNWSSLNTAKMPEFEEGVMKVARAELKKYAKARYIMFTLRKGSAWLFLDELSVIADIDGGYKNIQFIQTLTERYGEDDMSHDERIRLLNSVSTVPIDRTLYKTSVSKGKNYTVSRDADTNWFTDDNTKLTDGKPIEAHYESGDWVGFKGGQPLDIVVDLGVKINDAADFEISFFNNFEAGISLPDFITFSVSEDNKNFVEIGRIYGPSDRACTTFNYALKLQYAVSARYVKFSAPSSEFEWYLTEEAAVYRYGTEEEAKDSLYPDIILPVITKEEFWSSSESDYSKKINLIKGLYPQIMSAVPLDSSEKEYNSAITKNMLTDGLYSPNTDIHNGSFFKFHFGAHRDVVFDLTKTSTVTGFTASFVRRNEWAVTLPPRILYYLSDDGIDWYMVGSSSFPESDKIETVKVTFNLTTTCKARFVRFSFDVGGWAGCDELEVFGTKKVDSGTKALSSLGIKATKFLAGEYLKPGPDVLGGAKDILLSYHCSYGSGEKAGLVSVEQYMPYVAYIDRDGNMIDVMFDGYLYLPSGGMPSGGQSHKNSIKSDWEYVLGNMFTKDYNIDALNQAAQIVKDTLKLDSDYKYKVYVALLYPSENVQFGDIDGDGVSDKLTDVKKRVQAIEWYIDAFFDRFESGNYTNLEFAGFYWHHEAMERHADEMELLNSVSKLVHSVGYQFFWIPYYTATGYNKYKEYGFDFACMQPNYAFKESTPYSYLTNCATLAKLYNMCVEMELEAMALYNDTFYKRWMDYLKGGVYYGYMDALHMYYQGGMPGAFYRAAISEDPKARLIYEYTYDFIKGTLKLKPDTVGDLSFNGSKDTILSDTLISSKDKIKKFIIFESPKNGTVTINEDGSFMYYPNKGFTGTDSFSYAYSEQLDYSDPCRVNINIGN